MLPAELRITPVSITGSRPMSRASWRSRTNTRFPASALKPLSKRNSNRPRSTTIGVFGSTPVVEAEFLAKASAKPGTRASARAYSCRPDVADQDEALVSTVCNRKFHGQTNAFAHAPADDSVGKNPRGY